MKKYFGLVFIALLIACTKEQVTKQVMNDKIPQQLPDTLRKLNVNTKMAYIPGGEYKPFYSSDTGLVTVHPFLMDERPVTNSEFLAFVNAIQHAVVAAICAVLTGQVTFAVEHIHHVHGKIQLLLAGLAASHVQRQLAVLILCILGFELAFQFQQLLPGQFGIGFHQVPPCYGICKFGC